MNHSSPIFVIVLLLLSGCAQAAPEPTVTRLPLATTKMPESTATYTPELTATLVIPELVDGVVMVEGMEAQGSFPTMSHGEVTGEINASLSQLLAGERVGNIVQMEGAWEGFWLLRDENKMPLMAVSFENGGVGKFYYANGYSEGYQWYVIQKYANGDLEAEKREIADSVFFELKIWAADSFVEEEVGHNIGMYLVSGLMAGQEKLIVVNNELNSEGVESVVVGVFITPHSDKVEQPLLLIGKKGEYIQVVGKIRNFRGEGGKVYSGFKSIEEIMSFIASDRNVCRIKINAQKDGEFESQSWEISIGEDNFRILKMMIANSYLGGRYNPLFFVHKSTASNCDPFSIDMIKQIRLAMDYEIGGVLEDSILYVDEIHILPGIHGLQ